MSTWAPSSASSCGVARCQKSSQTLMPRRSPRRVEVDGTQPGAGREEAALVEEPVGGQEDLAMDVAHGTALEQRRGDEEAVVVRFLDEGDDGGQPVGRPRQLEEARVVAAHGHLGVEVLEQVAGQAELREDHQVSAVCAGLPDELVVTRQVLVERTEPRRDLGQRDGDALRRLMPPCPPFRVEAVPGR